MSVAQALRPDPVTWTRRHLLGLEDLSREELLAILDTAEYFTQDRETRRQGDKEKNTLGKVAPSPCLPVSLSPCLSSPQPLPAVFGRQGHGPSVLRAVDANAHQLQPGRPTSGGGHARLHAVEFQPQQGRDFHRHGQEHRGDGRRRHGGPALFRRGTAPARQASEHERRQRRRRSP